jgi:hypothetical protein
MPQPAAFLPTTMSRGLTLTTLLGRRRCPGARSKREALLGHAAGGGALTDDDVPGLALTGDPPRSRHRRRRSCRRRSRCGRPSSLHPLHRSTAASQRVCREAWRHQEHKKRNLRRARRQQGPLNPSQPGIEGRSGIQKVSVLRIEVRFQRQKKPHHRRNDLENTKIHHTEWRVRSTERTTREHRLATPRSPCAPAVAPRPSQVSHRDVRRRGLVTAARGSRERCREAGRYNRASNHKSAHIPSWPNNNYQI